MRIHTTKKAGSRGIQPFPGTSKTIEPAFLLQPRLAWMLCYEATRDAKAVCHRFDISGKTFYKWLRRYRSSGGNSASLADVSRRPHTYPQATPPSTVRILLEVKNRTGFGPRKLRAYLRKHFDICLSESTIWKHVKKHSVPPEDP